MLDKYKLLTQANIYLLKKQKKKIEEANISNFFVSQNNIINNKIEVWVKVAIPPKYSFETPNSEINLI